MLNTKYRLIKVILTGLLHGVAEISYQQRKLHSLRRISPGGAVKDSSQNRHLDG
jgi:hypothetical protein